MRTPKPDLYAAIHQGFDMQTIQRENGEILTETFVSVPRRNSALGFCVIGNERFDVRLQEDGTWVEEPDSSRPLMGRPSQGREKRVQAMVTPEQMNWLDSYRVQHGDKTLSDAVFRLITEAMQPE